MVQYLSDLLFITYIMSGGIKQKWLNAVLHFGSFINARKTALAGTHGLGTIAHLLGILILEAGLFLFSLPAYIFIAPSTLPASGIKDQQAVQTYRLRRVITLSVLLGTLGLWALYAAFGALGLSLFPGRGHAFTATWDFNTPVEYVYDTDKIQIVDGMAIFKPTAPVAPTTIAPSSPIELNTQESSNTEITPSPSPLPAGEGAIPDTSTSTSTDSTTSSGSSVETNTTIDSTTTIVTPPAPTPTPEPTPPAPAPAPAPSTNTGGLLNYQGPSLRAPKGRGNPLTERLLRFSRNDRFINTAHAQTTTCEATIQAVTPLVVAPLKQWTGFTEIAEKNGGEIYYQLSADAGITWYYWNGSAWSVATALNFNTAQEVNAHIDEFPIETAAISFKAKFVNDCASEMHLLTVSVDYDRPTQGLTITGADPFLSFTDIAGTPLTSAEGGVYVRMSGTPTAYIELDQNINLGNALFGQTLGKSWTSIGEPALSSLTTAELLIPKTNSNAKVRICPDALAPLSIILGCPNELLLDSNNTSAGAYALVKLDDEHYWHIQLQTRAQISLGAMEVLPEIVSTPSTPTLPTSSTCGTILDAAGLSASALTNQVLPTDDYLLAGEITLSTTEDSAIIVRHKNSSNLWKLIFGQNALRFEGLVNGVPAIASAGNTATFVPQVGAHLKFKIQVQGAELRAKWWLKETTEPATWLLYATDNRILSGGIGLDLLNALGNPTATVNSLIVSNCLEDVTALPETSSSLPNFSIDLSLDLTTPPTTPTNDDEGIITVIYNPQTDTATIEIENEAGPPVTVTTPPLTEDTHTIDVVYDGTNLNLYTDGVLTSTTEVTIALPNTVTPLTADPSTIVTEIGITPEIISPIEIASLHLQATNHAPEITLVSIAQQTDDGHVDIRYTLKDSESNFVSLTRYEFSLTGAFTGEEQSMTPAQNDQDQDHDGISTLASSSQGTAHTFVWNPVADLPSNYAGNVSIRLESDDGIEKGQPTTSEALFVDTKAPVITNLHATQLPGTDTIKITYRVSDDSSPVTIALGLSDDNGKTWDISTNHASGDVVLVNTTDEKTTYTIAWDAGEDFPLHEINDMRVQLHAMDRFADRLATATSAFALDTKAPFGLADLKGYSSNTSSILWNWSPVAAEANFAGYVLWYGTNKEAVEAHKSPAKSVTVKNDADLGIIGMDRHLTTGLKADTEYFAQLSALDTFGHITITATASFKTTATGSGEISEPPPALPTAPPPPPAPSSPSMVSTGGNSGNGGGGGIGIAPSYSSAPTFPTASVSVPSSLPAQTGSLLPSGENTGSISSPLVGEGAPTAVGAGEGATPATSANLAVSASPLSPAQRATTAASFEILNTLDRAKESPVLAKPEVIAVTQSATKNTIHLEGKAIPGAKVALFIHSDQVVVYTTEADAEGRWTFDHSQEELTLAPGEHTIYAVTYDEGSGVKSKPTPLKTFHVDYNRTSVILSYFDLWTTLLTIVVLFIVLTLFSLRRYLQGNS